MNTASTTDTSDISVRPRGRWAWLVGVILLVTCGWLMMTPAGAVVGLGLLIGAIAAAVFSAYRRSVASATKPEAADPNQVRLRPPIVRFRLGGIYRD